MLLFNTLYAILYITFFFPSNSRKKFFFLNVAYTIVAGKKKIRGLLTEEDGDNSDVA